MSHANTDPGYARLPGPHYNLITALRVVSGPLFCGAQSPQYVLSTDHSRQFVVGRGHDDCDWELPLGIRVSRRAIIGKRDTISKLHIAAHPAASQLPRIDDKLVPAGDLAAGQVFGLDATTIMAFNVAMLTHRRTLAWWLGRRADAAELVDFLLAAVTLGEPQLLLGEASTWPRQLARFLHRCISVRGDGPLTEVSRAPTSPAECMDVVRRSQGGAALVALPDEPSAGERTRFADLVSFLRSNGVGVYVTARNAEVAESTLGHLLGRFHRTSIPPLKARLDEMEPLLEGMVRWERVPFHVHTYAPLVPQMERDMWEGNFDDLRDLVRNYAEILGRGFNKAAEYLRIKRPTLYDFETRWGRVKLTPIKADPLGSTVKVAPPEPATPSPRAPRTATHPETFDPENPEPDEDPS